MCEGESMVLDDIIKNRAIENKSWLNAGFEATERLISRVISSCGIVRGFRKYHLVLTNLSLKLWKHAIYLENSHVFMKNYCSVCGQKSSKNMESRVASCLSDTPLFI
jgi:hypothetical protein